jgi:Tol biopolymer transport system component
MSRDYLVRSDGSGIRRLIPPLTNWPEYSQSDPAWSPDGKFMAAFFSNGIGLVILDVEHSTVTALGYGELFLGYRQSLTWTPDGRRIVFKGYSGEKYDIYSLDVESRELVNLTAQYPESFTLIPEWVSVAP